MIHRQALRITLMDPLVVSATAASEGGHRSVDYIPGNVLLGAAASRIYNHMSSQDAYQVFHSGQFRFGNGLPVTSANLVSLPVPLLWHEDKKHSAISNKQVDKNLLCLERPKDPENWRQIRKGFVAMDGTFIQPSHTYHLRTAINAETGRAKDGMLFGHDSLNAGQTFLSWIEADETVPASLFNQVADSLADSQQRLGRSRGVEYGLVQMERVQTPPPWLQTFPNNHEKVCRLWLLSDLALQDEHGYPLLMPTPQALGLPAGKLDLEQTFIRTRSYAPYNGKWQRHELERTVIQQGSVLHFEFQQPVDTAVMARLQQQGAGLYRQSGLGRMLVNSPELHGPSGKAIPVATSEATDMPTPTHPLVPWLKKRVEGVRTREDTRKKALANESDLQKLYQSARRLEGLPPGIPIGPRPSQWGGVMEKAKKEVCDLNLMATLFDNKNGIIREQAGKQGWEQSAMVDGKVITFKEWFKQQCEDHQKGDDLCLFVMEFSRMAMDISRKEGRP